MTKDKDQSQIQKSKTDPEKSLVARTTVPTGLRYDKYRPFLRHDFFYSCAYCTMSESEAKAIRFTIDHYESQKSRPDLVDSYDNLMYCCDECNLRKGNRSPPPEAREDGFRFFRPDNDIRSEHFQKTGIRIESKSNVGYYTIESLDLNRLTLRRIREIRTRLTKCEQFVSDGILSLRKFHIDQLPPEIRGVASRYINQALKTASIIADDIDQILRDYAKSPLLEPDSDQETAQNDRSVKLSALEALYPGEWRAPKKQPQQKDGGRGQKRRRPKKRRH